MLCAISFTNRAKNKHLEICFEVDIHSKLPPGSFIISNKFTMYPSGDMQFVNEPKHRQITKDVHNRV